MKQDIVESNPFRTCTLKVLHFGLQTAKIGLEFDRPSGWSSRWTLPACVCVLLPVTTGCCYGFFVLMWCLSLTCRFDLKNANVNDDNCEKMKAENLPDIVSIVCCALQLLCHSYASNFNVWITWHGLKQLFYYTMLKMNSLFGMMHICSEKCRNMQNKSSLCAHFLLQIIKQFCYASTLRTVCPCVLSIVNTITWKVLDGCSANLQHSCIWGRDECLRVWGQKVTVLTTSNQHWCELAVW